MLALLLCAAVGCDGGFTSARYESVTVNTAPAYEVRTVRVPVTAYRTETVKVPRTVYEEKEVRVPVTVYEERRVTVPVRRTYTVREYAAPVRRESIEIESYGGARRGLLGRVFGRSKTKIKVKR